MSVTIWQLTWHKIPKDLNLHCSFPTNHVLQNGIKHMEQNIQTNKTGKNILEKLALVGPPKN
jgi:hypothetical protein